MQLLASLLKNKRLNKKKVLLEKEVALVKHGREQFKKLLERGINVPIAYL